MCVLLLYVVFVFFLLLLLCVVSIGQEDATKLHCVAECADIDTHSQMLRVILDKLSI